MYHAEIDVAQWTTAPLQLMLTATVDAAPAVVFHALSDPKRMCRLFTWMSQVTVELPAAAAVAAAAAPVVGARRRCVLASGLVLEEVIVGWRPPHGYAYRGDDATHPFGMRGHVGVLSFEPAARGCRFVWQHYFAHGNVPAMRAQLRQSMETAVSALLREYGGQQDARPVACAG